MATITVGIGSVDDHQLSQGGSCCCTAANSLPAMADLCCIFELRCMEAEPIKKSTGQTKTGG